MRALDLYCGLGGWSNGLAAEGFEVMGVEIESEIAALYKHPVIVEDVRNLAGHQFPKYDLIVGSPPCRDFTRMCDHGLRKDGNYWKWKNPKNPERGLELVQAFLRIVREAQPVHWLMENVPGLQEHLDLEPVCTVKLTNSYVRTFWGDFPAFLVPKVNCNRTIYQYGGKYRKWLRAKMPLPLAQALGRAVREAIK